MPKKNEERKTFSSATGPIEVAVPAQTTPPVTREVDFSHSAESKATKKAKPQAAADKKKEH